MSRVIKDVVDSDQQLQEIHIVGTNKDFLALLGRKLNKHINVISGTDIFVQLESAQAKETDEIVESKIAQPEHIISVSKVKEERVETPLPEMDKPPKYNSPCGFLIRNNIQVFIYKHDIVKLQVDAIVNFTNETLDHATGIGKVIVHAAGPDMEREGRDMISSSGPLPVSHTLVTSAGELRCKTIIHVVGPSWPFEAAEKDVNRSLKLLHKTFINIFQTADKHFITTLAIPAVTSGEVCHVNSFPFI